MHRPISARRGEPTHLGLLASCGCISTWLLRHRAGRLSTTCTAISILDQREGISGVGSIVTKLAACIFTQLRTAPGEDVRDSPHGVHVFDANHGTPRRSEKHGTASTPARSKTATTPGTIARHVRGCYSMPLTTILKPFSRGDGVPRNCDLMRQLVPLRRVCRTSFFMHGIVKMRDQGRTGPFLVPVCQAPHVPSKWSTCAEPACAMSHSPSS